jgi:DNA-binding transcriptional ArsR family regulator
VGQSRLRALAIPGGSTARSVDCLILIEIESLRTQVALVLESPAVDRIFEALANSRRREILHWLQDPGAHFPPQEHGDLLTDGACAVFIVQKLGVSQPTASRHLGVLVDAELLIATRRKNWVY